MKRAFLFLGYGLNDWNMRVLTKGGQRSGYRVLGHPKESDSFERKLWERRSVEYLFDLSLEEFCGGDANAWGSFQRNT